MLFLLAIVIGLPAQYESATSPARNCSEDNGKCDQYCIDRNDGIAPTCACGCYYELHADNESCVPIDECALDMLFIYDFTSGLTNAACPQIAFQILTSPDFTPFEIWRDEIATYVNEFAMEIENGSFRLSTMVSGSNIQVTNNYGAVTNSTIVKQQIENINSEADEICGHDNTYRALYVTTNPPNVMDPVYPADAGYGPNTTRVAVLTMVTPLDSATNAVTLNAYDNGIHNYYDQVFVVSRKNKTQLTEIQQQVIEGQLRLMACRNSSSTRCIYLFYVDSNNDDGLRFSRNNVLPMIDRNACISRKPVYEHTVECDSDGATVHIPICLLGGLTRDDLQLNDGACSGTTYGAANNGGVTFTIPYESCSWEITANADPHVTLTQNIVTKNFGSGGSAKSVNFSVSCTIVRYTDEQLGIFNPAPAELSASKQETGTFDYSLVLYMDSTYSTAYTQADFPLTVNVLDPMYFAARAEIPDNLKIVLNDIVVSSSTDKSSAPFHTILENKCAKDSTFQVLASTNNSEVRFTLQMFEFTSTVNEAVGSKLPLYFHVKYYLCDATDVGANCSQMCAARKKRSLVNEENLKSGVIGPFYSAQTKPKETKMPNDAAKEQIYTEETVIFFPLLNSGYAFICWTLPSITAVLILLLGALIVVKASLTKVAMRENFGIASNGVHAKDIDAGKF